MSFKVQLHAERMQVAESARRMPLQHGNDVPNTQELHEPGDQRHNHVDHKRNHVKAYR